MAEDIHPNKNARDGRKERITRLQEMITNKREKTVRQVIGEFCIETGNTRHTALGYLDVLIDGGLVEAPPE